MNEAFVLIMSAQKEDLRRHKDWELNGRHEVVSSGWLH